MVSRRLNPFETGVVTIGSFDGKGQFNVIKDKVTIEGDVRALTDATRDRIETALKQIVHGLEETFGVNCEFTFSKDYPALYNDPDFTEYVAETIKQAKLADVKGVEICEPQPPSEDFAFMLKHCQVLLYILEQNLERVKHIHIIILNLRLMNQVC